MYKPKKYVRLDQLYSMPTVADCKRLLGEATKARGSTVELPWRSQKTYIGYSLTVRLELGGGEPIWTLYEGEGNRARVVWSSPFEDIDLMNDVLHLSLPGEEGQATPVASTPAPAAEEESAPQASANSMGDDATGMKRPSEGPDFYGSLQDFERDREQSKKAPSYPTPTITPVTPPIERPAPANAPVAPASSAPTPVPNQQPPVAAPAYQYPPQQQQQPGYPGYPPGYPPQGYPGYPAGYPPQGYPGYPPGYPVDPRYYQQQPPYAPPYGQPPAPQPAATVPVQPGALPSTASGATPPAQPQPLPNAKVVDPDLVRKRPNILLGNFLIEAGLIPEATLQAALQLQDMVKTGALKTTQAAEAVRRAHARGGAIDQSFFTAAPNVVVDPRETRGVSPPLGQILVEAGLIHPGALRAALNLQEVVRTGAMSKDDALSSFIKEHFGADEKPEAKKEREAEQAIDLLKQAGLLNEKDVNASRAVKKRHGGNIAKILAAAGKLDNKTFEAAIICKGLLKEERLKVEQAMIVLNYCQRSRMTFDEAIDELGWAKP